jgi:1,4-dihydroxy-2-naphthoyl-CoA synthase
MFHREGSFGEDVYEVRQRYRKGIQRLPLAMHRLEVPSIAVINGAALGASFDLACMCDLRVATTDAIMGETARASVVHRNSWGGHWVPQLFRLHCLTTYYQTCDYSQDVRRTRCGNRLIVR